MIPVVPTVNIDYRFLLAAGGLALFFYWYAKREVGAAVAAVGTAINPLDERNLANRAVTKVGETLTGSAPGSWSLGSWLYDVFNKPYDPNSPNTPRTRYLAMMSSPVQPADRPTAYLNG